MTVVSVTMRVALVALSIVGGIVGIEVQDWTLTGISLLGLLAFRLSLAADSYLRENSMSEEEIAAFNKEYRKW